MSALGSEETATAVLEPHIVVVLVAVVGVPGFFAIMAAIVLRRQSMCECVRIYRNSFYFAVAACCCHGCVLLLLHWAVWPSGPLSGCSCVVS